MIQTLDVPCSWRRRAVAVLMSRIMRASVIAIALVAFPAIGRTQDSSSVGKQGIGASASDRIWAAGDCYAAGSTWASEIRRQHGSRATIIVLLGSEAGLGTPCYYNRDYGVTGDPIYVGVFHPSTTEWTQVRFEPCAAESATPALYQTSELLRQMIRVSADNWKLSAFLPRRCFNNAVDISVTGLSGDTPLTTRYSLSQAQRYRATVQLGVNFTTQHDRTFTLGHPGTDTTTRILDQGPTNNGPEYVATLVLYSVLRYIPLPGKPNTRQESVYAGRDIVHDQGLLDRLHAVIGVGLNSPGNRFTVGGAFELIRGVNVLYTQEYFRTRTLNGVAANDPFPGTADQIPVTNVWKRKPVWGIGIDLQYAAQVLGIGR